MGSRRQRRKIKKNKKENRESKTNSFPASPQPSQPSNATLGLTKEKLDIQSSKMLFECLKGNKDIHSMVMEYLNRIYMWEYLIKMNDPKPSLMTDVCPIYFY